MAGLTNNMMIPAYTLYLDLVHILLSGEEAKEVIEEFCTQDHEDNMTKFLLQYSENNPGL